MNDRIIVLSSSLCIFFEGIVLVEEELFIRDMYAYFFTAKLWNLYVNMISFDCEIVKSTGERFYACFCIKMMMK